MKSKFLRDVISLFQGNIIFQIIIMLSFVFLTRNYTTDIIGKYSVFLSLSTILSSVASGRLELAIMLPPKQNEANRLFSLSTSLILLVGILTFITLFIYQIIIGMKIHLGYILIPISTIFMAYLNLQYQYLNRAGLYNNMSYGKIITAVSIAAFQIIVTYILKSLTFIILGYCVGFLVGILYYSIIINKAKLYKRETNNLFDFYRSGKLLFKKFYEFPLYNNTSSLFNILANQGPLILIDSVYGSSIAANFSVVQRTLNAPTTLFGQAFSNVFYKKVVDNKELSVLRNYVIRNTKMISVLGVLMILTISTLADTIYPKIFGEEYSIAATMAKILVFLYAVRLIFVSQLSILIAKNKLKLDLGLNFVYAVVMLSPIIISKKFDLDWKQCILLISSLGTTLFLYVGYLIFKTTK